MEHFTDSQFEEQIKTDKLVVVDCWAPWCGPCLALSPILEELSKELEAVATIGKLNVDEEPLMSGKFGIKGIPTLIFMKDGKEIDRLVGMQHKSVLSKKITELTA